MFGLQSAQDQGREFKNVRHILMLVFRVQQESYEIQSTNQYAGNQKSVTG